jgi:hypothetical protein
MSLLSSRRTRHSADTAAAISTGVRAVSVIGPAWALTSSERGRRRLKAGEASDLTTTRRPFARPDVSTQDARA